MDRHIKQISNHSHLKNTLPFGVGVYKLLRDLFIISGVSFLLLLIAEDIQPGFVSFWFDIKVVLLVVVISGFLTLSTSKFAEK